MCAMRKASEGVERSRIACKLHSQRHLCYWYGAVVFCVGVDVQADAGDAAFCVAAAGLLAVGAGFSSSFTSSSVQVSCRQLKPCFSKSCPCSDWPSHRVWSRFLPRTKRSRRSRSFPCHCAWGMPRSPMSAYLGPDVLAVGSGGFIPVYGRGRWGFRSGAVTGSVGRHFRGRFCPASPCPCFLTGWLWYLIMLVPVIGIVQVGFRRGRIVTRICRRSGCI